MTADMKLDPEAISGPWKAGYSLAAHTLSSDFLGYDEQGRAKFDTTRTEVGELLYRLKYQSDQSAVQSLASGAAAFITSKTWPVDVVVPLPPSKNRAVQPVAAVAQAVAKRLNLAYDSKALRKVKDTPELKSLADLEERKEALAEAFQASAKSVEGKVVLLVDDLYRSGVSMKEATQALLRAGAKAVYAVALTRTRVNR